VPTAVIVGASSGIGLALAKELSSRGYSLGLVARREDLLRELASELSGKPVIDVVDVTNLEETTERLSALFQKLGSVDLFIYNSGIGRTNPPLDLEPELDTIRVNVLGFVNATNVAVKAMERQGHGHLVGISSIASFRGAGRVPAYGASKVFMSNYLEALHCRMTAISSAFAVTNVLPGFVDTPMTKNTKNKFWVATAEKAARQIVDAIFAKRRIVYVTRRWRVVAWVMKALPVPLWKKIQR
jgi:short-subunit dehydrogenase